MFFFEKPLEKSLPGGMEVTHGLGPCAERRGGSSPPVGICHCFAVANLDDSAINSFEIGKTII